MPLQTPELLKQIESKKLLAFHRESNNILIHINTKLKSVADIYYKDIDLQTQHFTFLKDTKFQYYKNSGNFGVITHLLSLDILAPIKLDSAVKQVNDNVMQLLKSFEHIYYYKLDTLEELEKQSAANYPTQMFTTPSYIVMILNANQYREDFKFKEIRYIMHKFNKDWQILINLLKNRL